MSTKPNTPATISEPIIVEPVMGECWPDGFSTIGWRARSGTKILVQRGYQSQVCEWLEEHYPDHKWTEGGAFDSIRAS